MTFPCAIRVAAACVLVSGLGLSWVRAEDRIERTAGATVSGNIKAMLSESVKITTSSGDQDIPVDQIKRIRYDSEPARLNIARNAAEDGRLEDALKDFQTLKGETFEGTRVAQIQQDIQFFTAYCTAKLALSGGAKLADAETLLGEFVKTAPTNYRVLEATELLGDIQSSAGKFAEAEQSYNKLTSSTLIGFKMRGSVSKGYALLKQNKSPEAGAVFESVLKTSIEGADPGLKQLQYAASLGKGLSLADQGQAPAGAKLAEEVILNASEDGQLYARAFNAKGYCLWKEGNKKGAMLAYLHVDVLYPNFPQEHAEALFYLQSLWQELNKPEYAAQARAMLTERYASSSWAKKAAAP